MENEDSFVELATRLIKDGFQYFPWEMSKIIQKMKGKINNNGSVYFIFETKRFFEHCAKIQENSRLDIEKIIDNIANVNKKK
mgnify:CR=1 FL=1